MLRKGSPLMGSPLALLSLGFDNHRSGRPGFRAADIPQATGTDLTENPSISGLD